MVENPTIPPHMHFAWDKFKCFDWLRRQKLSILIWTINKELSALCPVEEGGVVAPETSKPH